jgi:hypothetical protein
MGLAYFPGHLPSRRHGSPCILFVVLSSLLPSENSGQRVYNTKVVLIREVTKPGGVFSFTLPESLRIFAWWIKTVWVHFLLKLFLLHYKSGFNFGQNFFSNIECRIESSLIYQKTLIFLGDFFCIIQCSVFNLLNQVSPK